MVVRRQFRRTSLIMFGLTLFLAGLIAVRIFGVNSSFLIASCVLLLNLILLRGQKNLIIIAIFLCLAFLFGIYRGNIYLKDLSNYKNLHNKQVTLEVTAKEDSVYSNRKQLEFSATNIETTQPTINKLIGNIKVEGMGVTMVYKGDRLKVTGKLYPRRGENVAGISFANIKVLSSGQSKIDKFRRQFATGLQNILPEPLASLGLGILIGQQNTLPDDLTEQLRQVGLIHIVAVSGYNLTIIIYFSQRLLKKRSRFQALVTSNTLIVLFLLVTGFSPSIVRAAVVSGIGLVMWYYGRNVKPLMILLLAAVITAGWNPLYIWSSVGWYLSFAAFFGVLVLGPLLHKRFVPARSQNKLLPQILTETIAAQICTIPILLYIFSTLSVISVVANILVVPLIPFVMLATLIAGIYGMIGPFFLGGVLVLPSRILLGYIVEVTQILSTVPYASIELKITASQTALICGLIIMFTLFLAKSNKQKLTSSESNPIV